MNFRIRQAAQYLSAGGVISHPTDTIQSLTCLPEFGQGLSKILQLKHRSATKGLILLASNINYFADFVADLSILNNLKNNNIPTTYLVKAKQYSLLTGGFSTIALRLTNNSVITQLCNATDSALVSTSANVTGKPCAKTILDLKIAFGEALDFIIAPQNDNNQASRIINAQTGRRLR